MHEAPHRLTAVPDSGGSAWIAYIGCRTTSARDGHGEGISVYAIDAETGTWSLRQLLGNLVNPSYFLLAPSGARLYTVHGDGAEVSSLAIDPRTGALSSPQTVGSGGRNPVHLALHPDARHLFVANYATGTVASIPLSDDGTLVDAARLYFLGGNAGPHKIEQRGAQPHQVVVAPGGRFLIVPDKGTDAIHVLRIDADELVMHAEVRCREASGPRHIIFDGLARFAYAANELDSTVTTYAWDGAAGDLAPLEIISTLPPTFVENSRAAAIALSADGRRLYVSNRGHDSICLFEVCPRTGLLRAPGWVSSGGHNPRFFTLDPAQRRLVVLNERSDTIVQIPLKSDDAVGSPEITSGSPVCAVFARLDR